METKAKIEAFKKAKDDVSAILTELEQFVAKYPKANLPVAPSQYKLAKEILDKTDFNIVVCGMVKSGKSSMVNAMIGQDLLPVNSDVATSIAFQVTSAKTDSFHVVYANGDRMEIARDNLARYGSQNEIDENGLEDASKCIANIEIKTPVQFLPQGITITDTPGIGSTYPHHTAITRQQVKFADAVIYVMNPAPLEAAEIEFLKEIAEITPSIMFVMTKADLETTAVADNIEGNRQHIAEAIGNKIGTDFDIHPMSSIQLKDAAQLADKDMADFSYEVSGYDSVKDAMLMLVYQTIGYYRAGAAYNEAIDYFNDVLQSLTDKKTAAVNAIEHYNELVDQFTEANKQFAEQMGDAKRKQVLSDVETILLAMKAEFTNIFSLKGDIYASFEQEISDLTLDQVPDYGTDLGDRVVTKVQAEWDRITSMAYRQMQATIAKYNDECQMAMPKRLVIAPTDSGDMPDEIGKLSKHDMLYGIRSEAFIGTIFTSAAGTIIGCIHYLAPALLTPVAPFIGPVMAVLSTGLLLWSTLSGREKAKRQKLEKDKKALMKFVADVLNNCQKQLTQTSLSDNKYKSMYQGFIEAFNEQARNSLNEIYEKYHKELESLKQVVIDSKQNPKVVEALGIMIADWQKKKDKLQAIGAEINELA